MSEMRRFDVVRVEIKPGEEPKACYVANGIEAPDSDHAAGRFAMAAFPSAGSHWFAVERKPEPPKHSPLPWRAVDGCIGLYDANGAYVNKKYQGNFAVVAKSVNAHEGLKAACARASMADCRCLFDPSAHYQCPACACKTALAAVEKPRE
jgi:hypothetical protein